MGKMTRSLALAGLAVTAGMAFNASPAMASPAAPVASITATRSIAPKAQSPRHDSIVGYYRTLRACDAAGRSGEHRNRWDDYDCNRVRNGGRRGSWALQVNGGGNSHHDGHINNRH
jgi:hypothetical protein